MPPSPSPYESSLVVGLSDEDDGRATPPFAGIDLLPAVNARQLRASIRSGHLKGRIGWTEAELLSFTKFILTFEKQNHIVVAIAVDTAHDGVANIVIDVMLSMHH